MLFIFFNEFDLKFFKLCDNSIFFTFSKIYVIKPLCDKAILACVIGKSFCVIQQFTLDFFACTTYNKKAAILKLSPIDLKLNCVL